MRRNSLAAALVLVTALAFAAAMRCPWATAAEPGFPAADQLPDLCRAAKADFRPLAENDVQQTKEELLRALDRLDRRLKSDGDNGEMWRKYLLWGELQNQLRPDAKADPAVLDRVHKRYAADHAGLYLVWFLDVREALWRYQFTLGAVGSAPLKDAFGNLLDSLGKRLQTYGAAPTAKEALVIGPALGQLADARQVPDLVAAIRHNFARPNLFLEVSADVIAAAMAEDVDETTPVRDVILGTTIRGTGHTVGHVEAKLVPDPRRAVVDSIFLGTTTTKNVGTNRQVRIYTNGTTGIGAAKRIWVDAEGLHTRPAVANVATKTEFTGLHANRQFVERIAWNRACKQKSTGEAIASQHARQRVCRQIDQRAAEMLDQANEAFVGRFRKSLLKYKLFPQQLDFSTTATALGVVALEADRGQLAAPTPPPPLPQRAEMALRLHQSMVDNFAASALAGRTIPDATFEAILTDLLGELPEKLRRPEDQEPWAVSFADQQPISITFADNGFQVTVRGRKYHVGEESYPGMNVTAVYKIAKTDPGFKAVRQGDLLIYPPGFQPGHGRQLSARQVVIRTMLERRFNKIFEPEILIEDMVMPENLKKVGKMRPVLLTCENAWITLVWKRIAADGAETATP